MITVRDFNGVITNSCVKKCPTEYYKYSETECHSCKQYCGKCTGDTDCQKCADGSYTTDDSDKDDV